MFKSTKLFGSQNILTGLITKDQYLYILHRNGLILRFDNQTNEVNNFLDLRKEIADVNQLENIGNAGLHSLAFHPHFNVESSPFRGVFYTIHAQLHSSNTHSNNSNNVYYMTCLVQYQVGVTPEETKKSAMNMLCIPEQDSNNNVSIEFSPDGTLWIGIGDIYNHNSYLAQDLNNFHGKLLRIKPLPPYAADKRGYIIPKNNPFHESNLQHHSLDGLEEIAAWGINHPSSITFDSNGRLWFGDYKSIYVVDGLGGNYGWPAIEGLFGRSPRDPEGSTVLDKNSLDVIKANGQNITQPIITINETTDSSIIGVVPMMRNDISGLSGNTLIAHSDGRIIMGTPTQTDGFKLRTIIHLKDMNIISLTQDNNGKLYMIVTDNNVSSIIQLDPVGDKIKSYKHSNLNAHIDRDDWGDWAVIFAIIVLIVVILMVIFAVVYAFNYRKSMTNKIS